jgi:hypothetical protein
MGTRFLRVTSCPSWLIFKLMRQSRPHPYRTFRLHPFTLFDHSLLFIQQLTVVDGASITAGASTTQFSRSNSCVECCLRRSLSVCLAYFY